LLLIRHAETVWNASGRLQGQADPPLSDRGKLQCEAVGARLQGTRIARVVSSDLVRARATAEAIGRHQAVDVELDPRLREVDLGAWEGVTRPELARDWPDLLHAWLQRPSWDLVPGGEGTQAFLSRVTAAAEEILAGAAEDDTVAVVTHIGVVRILLSLALGTFADELRWPWAIENTGLSVLEAAPGGARLGSPQVVIAAVNDSVHVPRHDAAAVTA